MGLHDALGNRQTKPGSSIRIAGRATIMTPRVYSSHSLMSQLLSSTNGCLSRADGQAPRQRCLQVDIRAGEFVRLVQAPQPHSAENFCYVLMSASRRSQRTVQISNPAREGI